MRVISISVLTLTTTILPVAAHAKAKPQSAAESTPTESAAARAARLALAEDTGALRDTKLRAEVVHVDIATPEANSPERTPSSVTEAPRSAAPLSGALEAVVAKQVSRNETAFDRCITEARARDPQLQGTVELVVNVASKRASAQIASGPADAAFSTCVAQTAQTLKLSLPDVAFPWKLTIGRPSGSTGNTRAALP